MSVLKDVAWREVKVWRKAQEQPKLEMIRMLIEEYQNHCKIMKDKRRRMLVKLRGGTAELGFKPEDGMCQGEKRGCARIVAVEGWMEDVGHCVLRCVYVGEEEDEEVDG